jgi:hypothetical protein
VRPVHGNIWCCVQLAAPERIQIISILERWLGKS